MGSLSKRYCVEDLRKERNQCNFNQEELTNVLDGGKEITQLRRNLEQKFLNDPVYDDEIPPDYLSHEDRYGNELRKTCRTFKLMREANISIREFLTYGPLELMKDGNPFIVHMGMFYDALQGQASTEQKEKWMGRVERGEIIGTYAQTEMGHGTFIRGLETTATYDQSTREFILHSPTITATKWWPGGLGKTSSYVTLMAQLYTKGKCYGPHLFMVQIRDEETHQSLPGVTVGEIGPRVGMNSNDNGFLRFDHCRIPRTHMLMKHSQVTEDGMYVKPVHAKLSYGAMVIIRVGLGAYASKQLQKAVTIATRYSAVRRQSELVPGEPEPQILDYQTQQYKLIPQIASVFALQFASQNCRDTLVKATAGMEGGAMDVLPELHALGSGLKALCSSDATRGVDICRLACGGHGYLASSNFARIFGHITAMITYDGENTVLWLQVARYLMKAFRNARNGDLLGRSVAYLTDQPASAGIVDLSNKGLVEAYKTTASSLVAKTEAKLKHLCDSGLDYPHAWNKCSISLVNCAQAHARYYVCDQYLKNVEMLDLSNGVRSLLRNLCRLYLIYHISLNEGDFLKTGALSASNIESLDGELGDLLAFLRPQAVSIVDSFDIDDKLIDSTLGAWDGNVYQRLYDEAQKSPLNKTDVPKAYYKYLRPLMKSNL